MDDMAAPVDNQFDDNRWGSVETATSTPTVHYINEAGVPEDVMGELRDNREIASMIEKWSQSLSGFNAPTLDVFGRKRWEGTRHIFAQMSLCAWAVENDDILGTLADVTEGLMFNRCSFDMYDDDQEDVWNQWAAEIDLDSRLREQARELYKVSQVYVGLWWGLREYTVRDTPVLDAIRVADAVSQQHQEDMLKGEKPTIPSPGELPGPGKGNRTRRKKFALQVPTSMTIFDPTKIFPVGTMMFGRERFAYIATNGESEAFKQALNGDIADAMVLQLIERKYEPTIEEMDLCGELGIEHRNLWLLRKDAVFRHSLTKAQYERFASVRLKTILPILDMKDHLRAADRAALMGNANFIVVITKGTDKLPAKPAEIENLREQAKVVARLPVLVGDHRLNVTIVAPPLDNTLIDSRWHVLDSRLIFAALKTFSPVVQGGNSSGTGVSEMSRVVSQGLENRRHMLVRAMERHIFGLIVERNAELTEAPSLGFLPKRISLDFQVDVINAILKVRDRGDISRESTLEELGFDEDVEVLRRAHEKLYYDRIFQSGTPYASPQTQPFAATNNNAQPEQQTVKEPGRPPGTKESEPRTPKDGLKA